MKLSCLSCLMCMLRCIFLIKLTLVTKMKEEISKDLLVQVFSLPHTLSQEMEVKLRAMMVCQKSHHPSIRLSSGTRARDWSLCRRWDPSFCSTTKCKMEEETQLHLLDCQALNDDSLDVPPRPTMTYWQQWGTFCNTNVNYYWHHVHLWLLLLYSRIG